MLKMNSTLTNFTFDQFFSDELGQIIIRYNSLVDIRVNLGNELGQIMTKILLPGDQTSAFCQA